MPSNPLLEIRKTVPTPTSPKPIKNQILKSEDDKSITAPVIEKGWIIIIKMPIAANKRPAVLNPLLIFILIIKKRGIKNIVFIVFENRL